MCEIDATDWQIDALVYQLYGLTDEEIRIVEGGIFSMNIDNLFIKCSNALDKYDLDKAKNIAEQLETELSRLPDDSKKVHYFADLGGILIDLGSWLSDEKIIVKGTQFAHNAICAVPEKDLSATHFYNLANGNLSLWNLSG